MHHTRLVFGQRQKYCLEKTGITILGARYQSEALATWMRRKDPYKVDVRWHPKDIGAISVKMGQDWFEIPAVDRSLEGVAAQTWLTAVRHVRAASPASTRVDMVAVREAIKAIASRNAKAMSAASLNLEDWSGDASERAEARVIAGVEFIERKAPKQTAGKVGRELPDDADLLSADPAVGPTSPTAPTQNYPAPKVASAATTPSLKVEEN
jgi:putative transposase